MVEAHASILSYFSLVDKVPGYQELAIIIPQGNHEEDIEGGGWAAAVSWGDEVRNSVGADADAAGALAATSATSVAAGEAAAAAVTKSEEKNIPDEEEELVNE